MSLKNEFRPGSNMKNILCNDLLVSAALTSFADLSTESPYFIEVAHDISSDLSLVQLQIRCECKDEMLYAEGTGKQHPIDMFLYSD